jgi:ABC-2 type transport system permease protein
MLLRPIPALLQLMFSQFRVPVLGDLLGGSVLLGIGLAIVDIDWSVVKVVFLIAALFGGAALDGAFQLGPAALTFRYLDSMPLRVIFDSMFMRFGGYPIPIFDRPARMLVTYLVPLAFMAWVPATILLDKTGELPFATWIAWCSPVIGVVLFAVAVWVFLHESRHYQSAGN